MSDILIIGTVAFDTIETPFGRVEKALGGSATYASFAASFFSRPALISVIGRDFPEEYIKLLKNRGINLQGLKTDDKTFHWEGFYEYDMNEAKTKKTELNSLENFKVKVPEEYKDLKYVFLANIDPEQQHETLKQMRKPEFVVLDTMNFWISHKKRQLMDVIKKADVLLLNDGEARQLFNTASLVKAANEALILGPKAIIIKKGEHGALLFTKNKHIENAWHASEQSTRSQDEHFRDARKSEECERVRNEAHSHLKDLRHFSAPGYPLENIKDPTGCGDSFGGAFIGYIAKTNDLSEQNFRRAIVYGSVVASHNAEDFGLNRLKTLKMGDIEKRYKEFQAIREF
ncbi:sugar kinase [Candidatus Woesearchaeota archaeon]|nr:sugar kinase [Candidatus Woesearchaeota archaeon]